MQLSIQEMCVPSETWQYPCGPFSMSSSVRKVSCSTTVAFVFYGVAAAAMSATATQLVSWSSLTQ